MGTVASTEVHLAEDACLDQLGDGVVGARIRSTDQCSSAVEQARPGYVQSSDRCFGIWNLDGSVAVQSEPAGKEAIRNVGCALQQAVELSARAPHCGAQPLAGRSVPRGPVQP